MVGPIPDIPNAIAAIGALGTAAYGLVDGSKAIRGGASNHGFSYIDAAMQPFRAALDKLGEGVADRTLRANWLNGVATADQKAAAKALVRLGLGADVADRLAVGTNINATALGVAAQKIDTGVPLLQPDMNILAQFDARLSAILDAAYERADQQYRNAAKLWSCAVAVVLALAAGWMIQGAAFGVAGAAEAILVGLVATPLAPVAKDLASTLQAAAAAVTAVRQ
jgi:hypothetical protein